MAESRHSLPELSDVLAQIAELRGAIDNLTRLMTPRPTAPAAGQRTLGVGANRRAAIRPPQRVDARLVRGTAGLPAGFRGVARMR